MIDLSLMDENGNEDDDDFGIWRDVDMRLHVLCKIKRIYCLKLKTQSHSTKKFQMIFWVANNN